jgi:hypothetical protein
MFAGFEFILILIKTIFLSSIYACIWLLISLLLADNYPESWFGENTKNRLKYWFFSCILLSIGLFFFAFSNLGNRGLGDCRRIPIGSGLAIENIDGVQTRIPGLTSRDYKNLVIENFKITDDNVVGILDHQHSNSFFVYDIRSQYLREFNSEIEFGDYLRKQKLPSADHLLTFDENYNEFWNGWRKWLLP